MCRERLGVDQNPRTGDPFRETGQETLWIVVLFEPLVEIHRMTNVQTASRNRADNVRPENHVKILT
jgi:hypothetical protein